MTSSGIEVGDEVLTSYNKVKERKDKTKTLICKISKKQDTVEIVREVEHEDWESVRSALVGEFAKEPVFVFYEFAYENDEGNPQEKVICINWSPDTASIKLKMLQSSTFDAVKKKVNHSGKIIEAHDPEDLTFASIKDKCEKK